MITNHNQYCFDSLLIDVQLLIFDKLSPQEKRIAALVSKTWRMLAEDQRLLYNDFMREDILSFRQITQLLGFRRLSKDQQYPIVLDIISEEKLYTLQELSASKVRCILETFKTHGIPEKKIGIEDAKRIYPYTEDEKWMCHYKIIERLGNLYRRATDFSSEKALVIFHDYIVFMKTQGFQIDRELRMLNETPLHSAVLEECPVVLRALLKAGAQVDRFLGPTEKQAIHYVSTGFPDSYRQYEFPHSQKLKNECIQILAEFGANPNALCRSIGNFAERLTPLWSAAHFGETQTVEALVKVGADVNQATNQQSGVLTPLQAAAYKGHLETVKTLISLGADPKKMNTRGLTAADLARENGFLEVAEYLKQVVPPDHSSRRSLKDILKGFKPFSKKD